MGRSFHSGGETLVRITGRDKTLPQPDCGGFGPGRNKGRWAVPEDQVPVRLQGMGRLLKNGESPAPEPNLLATAGLWLLMLLSTTLPLFLGGASGMGDLWLNTLGWSAVALWMAGLYQQRRFPAVSPWAALPLCVVLLAGALAALNPEFTYEGPFRGFTAAPYRSWLPSTVDAAASFGALRHWALLGALFCMSTDLCAGRDRFTLYRNCLGAGGFIQIAVALGQRLLDARSVLGGGWGEQLPFFGTFLYPGSAGAYLNLMLPLFCLHLFGKTQSLLTGVAGLAGLGVAIFWNTSRLSSLVGFATGAFLALALALGALQKREGEGTRGAVLRRLYPSRYVLLSVLAVGVLGLLVFPVPPLFQKWRLLPEQWNSAYPRFEAMKACLETCGDAGAWGFGAGTFASVFPHYAHDMALTARGVWKHAHCDYLEWFIEWGALGFLLWSFLPAGAFLRSCICFFKETSAHRRSEAACTCAALLALGMHALADFPLFNPGVQLLAVFWLGSAWSARPSVEFSRQHQR